MYFTITPSIQRSLHPVSVNQAIPVHEEKIDLHKKHAGNIRTSGSSGTWLKFIWIFEVIGFV
jgi:hypothetical protein